MSLLNAGDLAALLGADSAEQVKEWHRRYKWPHVKLGRTVRWTPEQADEIVRRHTVAGGTLTAADGRTPRSAGRRSA